MAIEADDVKWHAKQELSWADRNFTFRKALRALSREREHMLRNRNGSLHAPTSYERLVSLLTAELLGNLRLFALTTEGISFCFPGPFGRFSRVELMTWRGEDIVMLTVQENRLMRINLRPGLVAPGKPDFFEIAPSDWQRANKFIYFANILCSFRLWGDPESFAAKLDQITQGTFREMQKEQVQ
jgi:hypothetical protein